MPPLGAANALGATAHSARGNSVSAAPDTPATPLPGVAVVVLTDYLKPHQRWGWMRLVQGPAALRKTPGLRFAKVMGSGQGGGFSLRPSASHQGLIALFDSAEQGAAFLNGPHVLAQRERARHCWGALLAVQSARGHWDGQAWGQANAAELGSPPGGAAASPLAVLTRASIRAHKAVAFWRHAPASQLDLATRPGCLLAMGLGEAPLVRQCTFSLWRDTAAMLAYAHSGPHRQAIEAAQRNGFFSESLFVRMAVLQQIGQWVSPLQAAQTNPDSPTPATQGTHG